MKIKIKFSRYTTTLIIAWASCLILFGVGYAFFYSPQKMMLGRLQNQCRESQDQLDKGRLAANTETRKKLQEQCSQKKRLIAGFSTESDTESELVFEVGQIATELNLSGFSSKHLELKGHSTVGKSKMIKEAWLDVECSATFQQFARFVNQLERNSPVVFVEELFFRRKPKKEKGHDIKLQLSFLLNTKSKNSSVALATH